MIRMATGIQTCQTQLEVRRGYLNALKQASATLITRCPPSERARLSILLLPSIASSRAGDSDSVYTRALNQALRSLARQMGQIRNQSNPGP